MRVASSEVILRRSSGSLQGRDISEGDFSGGGGPLCCTVCGKLITGRNRRQRLQYHLLTHSGERNHSCPYCPYKALLKFTLDRHIRSVHKHLLGLGGADGVAAILSSAADGCSQGFAAAGPQGLESEFGGPSSFSVQNFQSDRGSFMSSVSFGRSSSVDEAPSSVSTSFVRNVSTSGITDAFPRSHDLGSANATSGVLDPSRSLTSPKTNHDLRKSS